MRLDGINLGQIWLGELGLDQLGLDQLWTSALAAVPLALGVWLLCRFSKIRPATRHMLWVIVMVSLVTPMIGSLLGVPRISLNALVASNSSSTAPASKDATDSTVPESSLYEPGSAGSSRLIDEVDAMKWRSTTNPPSVFAPRRNELLTSLVDEPSVAAGPFATESVRADGLQLNDEIIEQLMVALDEARADLGTLTETEPKMVPDQLRLEPTIPEYGLDEAQLAVNELRLPGEFNEETLAVEIASAQVAAQDAAESEQFTTEPTAAGRMASAAAAAVQDELGQWGSALVSIRDAVGKIPPIPAALWLFGIVALLGWRVVRIAIFLRSLKSGSEPSMRVLAQVRNIATEVGLSRTPKTIMLDRRMSPFVWCGIRPVLVLPVGLWGELDQEGQRAVLMHELAHVRRRDHLVLWLSQAVSLVYWWHPVVWWARRRIEEEADFACDAWVTALRPSGRRVYAETLVVAKSYVSGPSVCRVNGLPMASRNARQLSRRLTMVMTQRTSPGLSALGLVLAAGVAAAGMFVTPSLACPEDDKKTSKPTPPTAPLAIGLTTEAPGVPLAPTSLIAHDALYAPGLPTTQPAVASPLYSPTSPVGLASAVPTSSTSFDRHMLGFVGPEDPDIAELLKRIERLERALKELRAETRARPTGARSGPRETRPDPVRATDRAPRAQGDNQRLRAAEQFARQRGDMAAAETHAARAHAAAQADAAHARSDVKRAQADRQAEARQAFGRVRELEADKRNQQRAAERARVDVDKQRYNEQKRKADIQVERQRVQVLEHELAADRARVAGQAQAQERAVVRDRRAVAERESARSATAASPRAAAGPRSSARSDRASATSATPRRTAPPAVPGAQMEISYILSSGKLELLTQLMIRPDVPIIVSPEDGSITVYGTEAQQNVFAAFIQMIDPDAKTDGKSERKPPRAAPSRERSDRAPSDAKEHQAAASAYQSLYAKQSQDVRAQYATALQAAESMKAEQAQLEQYAQILDADKKKYQNQRSSLIQQAESMYKNAEAYKARSLDAEPAKAEQIYAQYKDLQKLAEMKEIEAQTAYKELSSKSKQMQELYQHMAELEMRAADMAAQAKAIENEIKKLEGSKD